MFHSIRWRIAFPYIVLILLAVGALTVYISSFLRQEYLDNLQDRLAIEAGLVAEVVEPMLLVDARAEGIQPMIQELDSVVEARITIVRADGVVLGDSLYDPASMENHLNRPEIQSALQDGLGLSSRFSRTAGFRMMYAAIPVEAGGEPLAVARVALPVDQIEGRIAATRNAVVGIALAVAGLAGLLVILSAQGLTRPLRRLTELVERMTRGELGGRIQTGSRDEIGRLAEAFNRMAEELESQLGNLAEQRNTLQAVLTLMADGVVITDRGGCVKLINPAAAQILGVTVAESVGERFVTLARDHQVVELWRRCQSLGEEQSETIEMIGRRPFLQVMVSPLGATDSLVLMQDLTKIRRLETVRRDFISNISHELRTPLASLRALVETLEDVALDDRSAAEHFLGLMDLELDALTQMVEELLELSRIESGRVPIRLVPTQVEPLVTRPLEVLRPQAQRAKVKLSIEIPDDLPMVLADASRVSRVVTNLVHNAIKFTPKKGRITVSAFEEGDEVVIAVEDTGIGIPASDQTRIFERFYKADQARSSGGTGLGLAIARHLVQAHGGRIWVESQAGQGSTFFFSLPAVRD